MHIWSKDEERRDQAARVVTKHAWVAKARSEEGMLRDRWQPATRRIYTSPTAGASRVLKKELNFLPKATWQGYVAEIRHVPRILEDSEIYELCITHKSLFSLLKSQYCFIFLCGKHSLTCFLWFTFFNQKQTNPKELVILCQSNSWKTCFVGHWQKNLVLFYTSWWYPCEGENSELNRVGFWLLH